MYKNPENIEDLKEALAADNPQEKDWDDGKAKAYHKIYGKPRNRNTHLTPKKKKRKK